MRHLSELRPVDITVTGEANDNVRKAAENRVYELERKYENALNEDGELPEGALPNIVAAPIVVTTNTPYKVYSFILDANFTTGTYEFAFVEEAPNNESLGAIELADPET